MSEPKCIYRTDGEWVAVVYEGNLFDTTGEWIGWLDDNEVYSLEGDYVGYVSEDGRLLRQRVIPYHKRRTPPTGQPAYAFPKTVPLPPLFGELSFSVIDVFEEEPELFALISELRPDAGEKPIARLVETDPRLAVEVRLRKVEQELLEEMVYGIIYSYGAEEPPVPVEAMETGLQPEASSTLKMASPQERLRISERFIEKLGHSTWATRRGYCSPKGFTPSQIQYAARALLMPRHWLLRSPQEIQHLAALAGRYVVTEETVILRLHDLE